MSVILTSYASGMRNDSLKFEYVNQDLECKGAFFIGQEGDVLLQMVIRNRNPHPLVIICPQKVYLHLYQLSDSNIVALEVMAGSQHLCPFNPFGIEPKVQLKLIAPLTNFEFSNAYRVPSYLMKKQIRYEVVLKYESIEALILHSDSVCIENLEVTSIGDSFFGGPTVVAFGNLRRKDFGGGIKTINMYPALNTATPKK